MPSFRPSFRPDLFVGAQAAVWPQPIIEIYAGKKETHWIWFVFPQLRSLGQTERAKLFGLEPEDASAYLQHPLLEDRLLEACAALLSSRSTPFEILGSLDAQKVRSSLTLFAWAQTRIPRPVPIFDLLLETHYNGQRCRTTAQALPSHANADDPA